MSILEIWAGSLTTPCLLQKLPSHWNQAGPSQTQGPSLSEPLSYFSLSVPDSDISEAESSCRAVLPQGGMWDGVINCETLL